MIGGKILKSAVDFEKKVRKIYLQRRQNFVKKSLVYIIILALIIHDVVILSLISLKLTDIYNELFFEEYFVD